MQHGVVTFLTDYGIEPVELARGVEERGFVTRGSDTSLVENGTFFNNRQVLPLLAYDENRQLQDRNERRKHGLEPAVRMAKLEDDFARRNNNENLAQLILRSRPAARSEPQAPQRSPFPS